MDLVPLGKWIVILGLVLIAVGGLIWLLGRTGLPLGRLPGDVRIEGENLSCYVPIVTMIVLSVILTIVLSRSCSKKLLRKGPLADSLDIGAVELVAPGKKVFLMGSLTRSGKDS